MADFLTTPVPHEEGAAIIQGKPAVTREVFDKLLPEFQSRAFTVTGVESLNVLQRTRNLAAELPRGGDWKELQGKILDEISPWIITATDPEERAKQESSAVRRSELILRNEGWKAYAVTNHQELMANADVFTYCQYVSSEDSRVRASHAALNGKVFKTDDVFWQTHTPPWEHGCRCDKVGIMEDEAQDLRDEDEAKPIEDRRVIEGPMLEQIHQGNLVMPGGTGKLDIRTQRQKTGKGYEWDPGTMALSYDDILARYDAETAGAFRQYAEATKLPDGRTLAETLGGPPAPAPKPVPKPAPKPTKATPAAPTPPPGATPAKVAATVPPVRKSPVSDALTVTASKKKDIRHALEVIDDVHDDGQLPKIPVKGGAGNALGHYQFTHSGSAIEIAVKATGSHPGLTLVHEVGHFLDHQGMGAHGTFQSMIPTSPVGEIVALLKKTRTFGQIAIGAGGPARIAYFEDARELWARAYAQYIAVESADPILMAQLDALREGWETWRQWPDDEFEAIQTAIRSHFTDLGWIPQPPAATSVTP